MNAVVVEAKVHVHAIHKHAVLQLVVVVDV